jgi:hypothetical protein
VRGDTSYSHHRHSQVRQREQVLRFLAHRTAVGRCVPLNRGEHLTGTITGGVGGGDVGR